MISPRFIQSRADAIMAQCGGVPTRAARANPTPATKVAMLAYDAQFTLNFARDEMWFIRHYAPGPLASFEWAYRAYASKRRIARACIRSAGRKLSEAEEMLAQLSVRDAA